MCESSTTQTTTPNIPEMSEIEKESLDLINKGILPMYLSEAGYELEETTSDFDYTQSPAWLKAQEMREKAQEYQSKFEDVDTKGKGQYRNPAMRASRDWYIGQAERLEKEAKEHKSEKSFKLRKKDPLKVEAIREEYGADSEEYKAAKKEYTEETIKTDEQKQQLVSGFMEKAQKFLDGDFSINEEQKRLIQENMAPQRAVLNKMYNEMQGESDKGFDAEMKVMDQFFGKIRESGMDPGMAVNAMGGLFGENIKSMGDALDKVISTNRELLKMGIEDATGEITKSVASQAAALGREPSDPEFQMQMKQMVSREVQRGSLGLAQMEAQGKLGIQEQAMALRGQEFGLRSNLAGRRGGMNMEMARGRGLGNLGLEEQASNLRYQMGGFLTPQQTGNAMGVAQYQDALRQQGTQNLMGAGQLQMGLAQMLGNQRLARASTTTSGTSTPSPLETITNIGIAAALGFG